MTDLDRFRTLHAGGVLVLPNAWDVASALLAEQAGAAAVATTSGAVAWSLGAADGDQLDRGLIVEAVRRIARAVSVPVTADIESGGPTAADVAETVRAVVHAGAVGVNLEDAGDPLREVSEQAERIAAAKAAGPVWVNARTDVYLRSVGSPEERLPETLRRAAAYVEAGADSVFVPGVVDPSVLRTLAAEIPRPLNVLAGPGAPSVPELASLGVRRVSLGTALAEAAYGAARRAAAEVLTSGTYSSLEGGIGYGELQALLAKASG